MKNSTLSEKKFFINMLKILDMHFITVLLEFGVKIN